MTWATQLNLAIGSYNRHMNTVSHRIRLFDNLGAFVEKNVFGENVDAKVRDYSSVFDNEPSDIATELLLVVVNIAHLVAVELVASNVDSNVRWPDISACCWVCDDSACGCAIQHSYTSREIPLLGRAKRRIMDSTEPMRCLPRGNILSHVDIVVVW